MQYRVDSEIQGSHIHAQFRTYHWEKDEDTVSERDDFLLSLNSLTKPQPRVYLSDKSTAPIRGPVGLIPCNFPTYFHHPGGSEQYMICYFQRSLFEEVIGLQYDWSEKELGLYLNLKSPVMASILTRIMNEVLQPGFASKLLVDIAGSMALVELARYLLKDRGPQISRRRYKGLSSWQLKRIQQRIDASLELGCPNLSDLAMLCGISTPHLMRSYKISTGTTIHKDVVNARLVKAKQLLRNKNLSTKEIAFRLGFSSPSHFSAAFRQFVGMSPSDFRNQVGGGVYVE